MKVLLTTMNAKFIHVNLALRWIYVAQDKGHQTDLKEYTIKDDIANIVQEIIQGNYDVIGLSIYIWNVDQMRQLIQQLRAANYTNRIVIGGPEVSYSIDDWLEIGVDAILQGEGEVTFWQYVNYKEDIDGLITKNYRSKVKFSKVNLNYLETLESPYFLPFDDENRQHRYLYLETSRGCPYQCSYCLSSLDSNVRSFSEEYIIKQLKMLETHPCKQVKFLDRTFNVNPKRALLLAQTIENLAVNFNFQLEIVVDTLSAELLNFFDTADVNKYRFEIGIQSFNLETLKAVHRYQNFAKLKSNIQRLQKIGYTMHIDLIAGLPYEDFASFKQSYHQLFSFKAGEIQVGILKLLKGTSLAKQSEQYGFIANKHAPYDVYQTKWLTKEELIKIGYLYHATEKLYNNGRLRKTLITLFDYGYDIFSILINVGRKMENQRKNIQVIHYFNFLYEELVNCEGCFDEFTLQALLKTDYYRIFKQQPKRLFAKNITQQQEKKFIEKLVVEKNYDPHLLYNYGRIEYGFNEGQVQYQLIIYQKDHKLPKIEWIGK